MKIDSDLIRKLRAANGWTQGQLGEAAGLDPRTIQRIESSGNASADSARRLATALGIDPSDLCIFDYARADPCATPLEAIRSGFVNFADFSGTATRYEYWWFFLFALLVVAAAAAVDERLGMVAGLVFLVPLLAAGTRRLHDTGNSGWWQVLFLVPFGFVGVFFALGMESEDDDKESSPSVKTL